MKKEIVEYQLDGKVYKGYLAYNESVESKRPCVLVAHAWKGQDDFAKQKAEALAELGYIGFALDLFGGGKTVESDEEAGAMIAPLFTDRQLIRDRMQAGYNAIADHHLVEKNNIAVIGFCFGGLSALELFKNGAKLKGTVSFHGLLGDTLGDMKAEVPPLAPSLNGSVLVLHGHLDPMVTQKHIQTFQTEMTEAKVDWQMHVYGNASHAFTNPLADNPESGLLYNRNADQRSWRSMMNFFEEVFS